jgi:tryptophan synthase alpha chain
MSRIAAKFQELKSKGEKALVGFVTAGDPDIETSLKIIKAMCKGGVDILELGVPFSDPTADGPVIQRSSARALKQGINLTAVIKITRQVREFTHIPMILFSYYNPILAYGVEKFYEESVSAGADGVLVVDLPPEESDEMTSQFSGDELALIRLVAPTTPPERMAEIANGASGFLYLISKTGVTGSDGLDTSTIKRNFSDLRQYTNLPICVGFGIASADHVATIASVADGVVVGSAFERIIEENVGVRNLLELIEIRVSEYKGATRFR